MSEELMAVHDELNSEALGDGARNGVFSAK